MTLRDFAIIFIQIFFGLIEWAIIIQVIYSWVRPRSTGSFYRMIVSIVSPFYRTVRRVIPPFGVLDLTPLFCLIGIELIAHTLIRLIASI